MIVRNVTETFHDDAILRQVTESFRIKLRKVNGQLQKGLELHVRPHPRNCCNPYNPVYEGFSVTVLMKASRLRVRFRVLMIIILHEEV